MDFTRIQHSTYEADICWLEISQNMQVLSTSLRNGDDSSNTKDSLIILFDNMFQISIQYGLDMNKAWDKWHKKACTKKYTSL